MIICETRRMEMLRKLMCTVVFVLSCMIVSEAHALPRHRMANVVNAVSHPVASIHAVVSGENATAQGVANIMARRGIVGHFGGNPGYEGCGCGATPEAAYRICCYANSGMTTVDVGYAQGANGTWFCCRRYR